MFCHLNGDRTEEIKILASSYIYFFVGQFCYPLSSPDIHWTYHLRENAFNPLADCIRRPRKVKKGAHKLKQPQFLFSSPSVFGVIQTQRSGLTHHHKHTTSAMLSDILYRWSWKTPGPLQPDQSVQIGLVLDKQHSYPCCQVHRSALRVLFEKCCCPEKIFTQRKVGCTAP